MFGSDSDKNKTTPQPAAAGVPPVASPATSMIAGSTPPADSVPVPGPNTSIAPTSAMPTDSVPAYLDTGPPSGSPTGSGSNSFIATGSGAPAISSAPGDMPMPAATPAAVPDDLMKIKQQALQNLAPLIDKLDQAPEERFKTLMMMIQASDNSEYLDEAYDAANGIKDEKEKAQALLDIVNEINYFTQNNKPDSKL